MYKEMICHCPDLTGYEERKIVMPHGEWETTKRPIMKECEQIVCAAYKNGTCKKYGTSVHYAIEVKDDE